MYTISKLLSIANQKITFSKIRILQCYFFLTFTKYKSYFLNKCRSEKVTFSNVKVLLSYFFVFFTEYKVTFLTPDCKIIFKVKMTIFLF
jgi:hypothetical protein